MHISIERQERVEVEEALCKVDFAIFSGCPLESYFCDLFGTSYGVASSALWVCVWFNAIRIDLIVSYFGFNIEKKTFFMFPLRPTVIVNV